MPVLNNLLVKKAWELGSKIDPATGVTNRRRDVHGQPVKFVNYISLIGTPLTQQQMQHTQGNLTTATILPHTDTEVSANKQWILWITVKTRLQWVVAV